MAKLAAAAVRAIANGGWHLFQAVNRMIPAAKAPHPDWAPQPLLKSCDRSIPPLGWPRETDSLCPRCAIEARNAVVNGDMSIDELVANRPGEIKARILEADGRLIMRKTCEKHGTFEDVLSIDPAFSRLVEERSPGRDLAAMGDELIHRHGSSSIKYGRGSVLNIDLTNRCNMMCTPCFANANQSGVVYELTLDEIKCFLDRAISFKPRRQMSVQFTGGEPTISPHFLDACRYAKKLGYYSVQAASNGIRFALEPDFAAQAREAGLNMVYLQFDGTTNEANAHRHITNLFDLKRRAIANMAQAKIQTTLVTTLVNGLNNDQVGPILDFAIEHCDRKTAAVSFQPIAFTGRDEDISDEDRQRQRYTISHLAHELRRHTQGRIDPLRDWYPLGVMTAFTSLADHLRALKPPKGRKGRFGGLACACHPDCGSSVMLMCNKKTKAWAPITQFFDIERFIADMAVIVDTGRGWNATLAQLVLAFLRNFDERQAPPGLTLKDFLKIFNKKTGRSLSQGKNLFKSDWRTMWVGGMHFQDLWVYDFRRTEMCSVPYGTQEGEISFCAFNTGIGWRQIIESRHRRATIEEWFKTCGRHKIYGGDRPVQLEPAVSDAETPVAVKKRASASA
ncbi:MAG: radical SAM protein [Desulfobacterales bacterium]|nr:radical SAM protein [Desulfobacterales bacterium]